MIYQEIENIKEELCHGDIDEETFLNKWDNNNE